MILINSFNDNFVSNNTKQQVRIINKNSLNSFSKNFKCNVDLKSNVQKKNNNITTIRKKNI